jgi:hypothetical protein
MTFPATAWNASLLADALGVSVANIDFSSATPDWKCALYVDGVTYLDKTGSAASQVYAVTNEAANTGDYTAGGGTYGQCGTTTITQSTNVIRWAAANATQVWGAVSPCTWAAGATAPAGLIVYANASVATKRIGLYVNFGAGAGQGIAVTASTLTVTWDSTDKMGKITV